MTSSARPLVSVAIATHNRADLLPEAVGSVLAQTMPDLEVVVVDDGSADNTEEVVRGLADQDPRVRYVHQENAGISAARNHAADEARGLYTAVHDDDDIMLPWRLEKQLETIERGAAGAYGSFVNFDDQTGDLVFHHGRNFTHGAVLLTGFAPGHSTWLVRTDILRTLRYDETLTSAVDNNLALRMLRSGISLHHSGVICVLRRVHGRSITAADAPNQTRAARMSREMVARGIPPHTARVLQERAAFDWGTVSGRAVYPTLLSPYLPDHLAQRSVLRRVVEEAPSTGELVVRHSRGTSRYRLEEQVSLADLLELHRRGLDLLVRPHEQHDWVGALVEHHIDHHVAALASAHPHQALVWSDQAAGSALPEHDGFVVVGPDAERTVTVTGPLPVADALAAARRAPGTRVRLLGADLESVVPGVRALAAGAAR